MQFDPKYLQHFANYVLVQCPRCATCAHLRRLQQDDGRVIGYRLVCPGCVHDVDWRLGRDRWVPVPSSGPVLPGFNLKLWLQTPCCGEVLWAYNLDHVAFLEEFIAAELRERLPDPQHGRRNGTLQSRLPKWILAAGNREAVLRSLAALRERAAIQV